MQIKRPHSSPTPQRHPVIRRAADGSLRIGGDDDIGEVWAQQRRLRLQRAIEDKKRKLNQQKLRKERGLVGLAGKQLHGFGAALRATLFGEQPAAVSRPKNSVPNADQAAKTVEIKISLPSLGGLSRMRQKVARTPYKKVLRSLKNQLHRLPHWTGYAIAVAFIAVVALVVFASHRSPQNGSAGTAKAPGAVSSLPKGTPDYPTILPAGKSIQQLGGWTRVSPPNRDPVYAFVDKVGAIPVDVSEQPLPKNFRDDTANQIAQLAKSFNATEKLTAGANTFYIGNSVKGPQSVILSKNGLLILIKSTAPLTNDQWVGYIASLQ